MDGGSLVGEAMVPFNRIAFVVVSCKWPKIKLESFSHSFEVASKCTFGIYNNNSYNAKCEDDVFDK